MQRVKGVEKAKHKLSSALETDVSPLHSKWSFWSRSLDVSIERDELEDLVGELIERLAVPQRMYG